MKILEEAFSNKRLDVGHFRIFGSSVYCHVTKYAQNKLEPIVELGIFGGYTDTPHNYWAYMLASRMIVVCRDVNLGEQKAMQVSLDRELLLQVVEKILVPKIEEP